MTKQETTALLEAVKNAPIVDGKITVTVCGTTFTFGNEWNNRITEESREKLLDSIGRACRVRLTRSIPRSELDRPAIRSQKLMLWWKDNIGKTKEVLKSAKVSQAYHEKWDAIKWYSPEYRKTEKERNKDYDKVKKACKKIGVAPCDIEKLAYLRGTVPRSWEKA